MILRHVLNRSLGRCGGGWWGVTRPTHPTPRLMSLCCARRRGVSEVPGLGDGEKNYLHTHSLSCRCFSWSRRKRRREVEGLVSISCPYTTNYSKSTGMVEEVKDDEAQQMVVMESGGDGQFHDTQYHYHNNIKDGDVGVQVNVGEPVIQELHRLFNIPRKNALKMVRTDNFLLASDKTILKTLYFLKEQDISPEQLQRIPSLLLDTPDQLRHKFESLLGQNLFRSLTDGLGFCSFSRQEIIKYQNGFIAEAARFPNHPNRVYYIADRMKMPVPLVTEKIVKPKSVLRMNMNKVNQAFEVLYKYNVQMKFVLSDMWVFCHNIQFTEERLSQAVEAGCKSPKPWICHASLPVYQNYLKRLKAKNQVLGEDGDVATYLSERLQCSMYEVQTALRRNYSLKQLHAGSMKTKLDLLFDAGFTRDDIRGCLRVLQYPIARTKERIEEMKSLGQDPFPISILFKQPSTYFNHVRKIKKAKKEEEMKNVTGMKERNEEESSEGEGRER